MRGILLVNTGSPLSDGRKDVRAFIEAMLCDPLMLPMPDKVRTILVKGIIGPVRQFASSKHYSLIWDREHNISPLLYHMQVLRDRLEETTSLPTAIAMRYLQPDIISAFEELQQKHPRLHEVIVVPLFPQYAESSYQSVVDEVGRCFLKRYYPFRIKFTEPYFDHPAYIKALAKSIKPYTEQDFDYLLFDFHSLPLTHVEKGWKKGREFDYVYQLKETIRLVRQELMLDQRKMRIVYSSAIGGKWLKPDLDDTLKNMAKDGVKKVLAVTPGFAVDNLETLYDITIKANETFIANGGESLQFVPCLNSESYWIEGLSQIISEL